MHFFAIVKRAGIVALLSFAFFNFAQAETFTGNIYLDSTGSGCSLVGVWDGETSTCTLTRDILGSVTIYSNGLNLDGGSHTISRYGFQNYGISVGGSNVVIKNINVSGFSNCIIFNGGKINGRVENSSISSCGSYGIYMPASSGGNTFLNNNIHHNYLGILVNSPNNTFEGNTFSANSPYGMKIYFASNNIIKNNVFSDNRTGLWMEYGAGNRITDNTIQASSLYGLYATTLYANKNYIVNNNFINNGNGQVSTRDLNQYYDAMPVGGNYWSDYDESTEGCKDLNHDSICDQPKYFNYYKPTYGDFYPWVRRDGWKVPAGCTENCFSNVLFLPGIEASRLYAPRADGSEDQLWEPNGNSDVEDLYLNTDGTSKKGNIYTRDIIKETNSPLPSGFAGQNIYKSFSTMMDELVTEGKINEWQAYAYDWRQSVDDVVNNGTKYADDVKSLVATLQALADNSKSGKVTIVAHSNGGLLAKALLKKLQEDKMAGVSNLSDSVDVLILVASPQIGTASAVPSVLHGYDQSILGGWLLDEVHARELARNMQGALGVLPSAEYINRVGASPATFVDTAIPSGVTTKMVQTFGSAIDSYSEYKSFLFGGEGRTNPAINEINLPIVLSQNLFADAENLHNAIDAWTPPENLRVIEVAGWGLDTVGSFEYYPVCESNATFSCTWIMDQRPRFTADGDGTVVVPSAQYMSVSGDAEKYWVDINRYNQLRFPKIDHANVLEVNSVNSLIASVIEDGDIILDAVLRNSKPLDTSNRLRLSIHSPVTIDAYDVEGNHTGKFCPTDSEFCYAEENIANSSYLEFGEGKYINLPEEEMAKVVLQGTDIGTFTYESEQVAPDGTTKISSFIDIPVTSETQAEITLNPVTSEPEMRLDVNGDGVNDFTVQPGESFDPILYLNILKVTINSLDLPPAKKIAFGNRVDNIIKMIEMGKIDQASLKAEKFRFQFEKVLAKSDPKKPKPHKVSKEDAQLLLDMLNKLLDNIR